MAEGDDRIHSDCASTSSSPCPICLGPFLQESYLDHCFHKFCYNCILRWTKVVSHKLSLPPSSVKCPLCKTENFSIIYEYDGVSFRRHYFNQDVGNSAFFSEAHNYRLQCYYVEDDDSLSDEFGVARYWKFRKYLQPNRWLRRWLRREIQALIQEEDVEIIVHHVLGVMESLRSDPTPRIPPEASRENFKTAVREAAIPFVGGRADRFANELELFLASGLNIEAYDKVCKQNLGFKQLPGVSADNGEGELAEGEPANPYLHFFDGDSDGAD